MHSIGNSLAPRPIRARPQVRPARGLLLALLFALAPCAYAQQSTQNPPIQQQMTPAQFKAAGLDKLNAEQLANLNAWLNGTIQAETSKAVITAKKQVEDANRGFFNFGSSEPVASKIVGEFRGFGKARSYTLANGQVWEQTDATTLAGVKLASPQVKITPSMIGNAWYLQVQGYNKRAKVVRIK